jgi:hypothetical protein
LGTGGLGAGGRNEFRKAAGFVDTQLVSPLVNARNQIHPDNLLRGFIHFLAEPSRTEGPCQSKLRL